MVKLTAPEKAHALLSVLRAKSLTVNGLTARLGWDRKHVYRWVTQLSELGVLTKELSDRGPGKKGPSKVMTYRLAKEWGGQHGMDVVADAARVIAWAFSSPRKAAIHAFTDGPDRQAAYWIEWAESRAESLARRGGQ